MPVISSDSKKSFFLSTGYDQDFSQWSKYQQGSPYFPESRWLAYLRDYVLFLIRQMRGRTIPSPLKKKAPLPFGKGAFSSRIQSDDPETYFP